MFFKCFSICRLGLLDAIRYPKEFIMPNMKSQTDCPFSCVNVVLTTILDNILLFQNRPK